MKKPVKQTKTTPAINFNYNKVESKLFLEKGLDSVSIDGTILRRQYICDNSDNDINLTVSTVGEVSLGDTQYKLADKRHEIAGDERHTLGKNMDIDGKKLKIVRTVMGEIGVSCTTSVWIEGGYKDTVYKLSSKIGEHNSTTFVINIEFI